VRAPQRDAGPVIWQIRRAVIGTIAMDALLELGWEPFAVDGQLLYARKQTVAATN
jgi:hypothetical protein